MRKRSGESAASVPEFVSSWVDKKEIDVVRNFIKYFPRIIASKFNYRKLNFQCPSPAPYDMFCRGNVLFVARAEKACAILTSQIFQPCEEYVKNNKTFENSRSAFSTILNVSLQEKVSAYQARCVLTYCQALELALLDSEDERVTDAISDEASNAVCHVISDYARVCRMNGVISDWRTPEFCGK